MAQSVKHLTSAQVMISRFMGSSPMTDFALTAQILEPTSDSVSPSLLSLRCSYSLSPSKINIKKCFNKWGGNVHFRIDKILSHYFFLKIFLTFVHF